MAEIVLATLNARYIHASLGLRYLRANLGELRERSEIREFTVQQAPAEIATAILSPDTRVVGLGVYIWNVQATHSVVRLLKTIRPDVTVILGGPEVSYERSPGDIHDAADLVIRGEGEDLFRKACNNVLSGEAFETKTIGPMQPDVATLAFPYGELSDEDVAHRVVYVEASRGCPFRCEFCLSSLDVAVRRFALEPLLDAFDELLERGVRHFKFVDRTFNLKIDVSRKILEFFASRYQPDLFLHFEMIPDRLPTELRALIQRFPKGALQFEIGIQTFNPEVAARIGRRQDYDRLRDNLSFLRHETGVHLHTDLIVGLPGEDLASIGSGFDALMALEPHEIQVGILKRLKGTPIGRHDQEFGMVYSPDAPYEILMNQELDFDQMNTLKRFAKYWDLFHNQAYFSRSLPSLWTSETPFQAFSNFSEFLWKRWGRGHGVSLEERARALRDYLVAKGHDQEDANESVRMDYGVGGRPIPRFLMNDVSSSQARRPRTGRTRQDRHADARRGDQN